MSGEDCFVCRKHRGEVQIPGGVIYQDELLYASHAQIPEGKNKAFLGTLFIEPKRHADAMEDLTEEEAAAVGRLARKLSRALKAATKADGIYLFHFGHHVHHFHLWLVPRYPGTPRKYWGTKVDEWPEAPFADAQEISQFCDQVRLELTKVDD
ncbi:MAG: HIT family protein [Chloroflexi bacterium]|nr:HIT family protein [Chloroflexota bacterium]